MTSVNALWLPYQDNRPEPQVGDYPENMKIKCPKVRAYMSRTGIVSDAQAESLNKTQERLIRNGQRS